MICSQSLTIHHSVVVTIAKVFLGESSEFWSWGWLGARCGGIRTFERGNSAHKTVWWIPSLPTWWRDLPRLTQSSFNRQCYLDMVSMLCNLLRLLYTSCLLMYNVSMECKGGVARIHFMSCAKEDSKFWWRTGIQAKGTRHSIVYTEGSQTLPIHGWRLDWIYATMLGPD